MFRKALTSIASGEVVIPVIRAALFDPKFKSFNVKVRGFEARPPDGYFHPSTHPAWPERMLYYYLTDPWRMVAEAFDPHGVMAVTQGHFWHSLIQHVGKQAGLFNTKDPCACGCKSDVERSFQDPATNSRGHVDGLLPDEVFEFKTMRPSKLSVFPKLDPDDPALAAWYADHFSGYYHQGQEYMRLSGYRSHRTLILSMDYPYEMREVVLPYDAAHAYGISEKYKRVIQAAADLRPPSPCCAPGSKESTSCPARTVCPNGVVRV